MTVRRPAALLGLALAVAACTSAPSPSVSVPAATAASDAAGPSAGFDAGLLPGQPYDADDVLAAMRDSVRPGGVPEELQTDEIAAAVADAIWTIDGEPWSAMTAGGSCGADSCTLEVAGAPPDGFGEDVWVFTVTPSSGAVVLAEADLHGVPVAWVDVLDRMAREAHGSEPLADLALTAVRWHPPPAEQTFALAYRSGDEEQSCSADLDLDASSGVITDLTVTGC